MVVVGSQDVIAAKCCPGHSVAAQGGGKEKDKVGSWRKNTEHLRIQSSPSSQDCVNKCTSGSFLIKASCCRIICLENGNEGNLCIFSIHSN